MKRTALILYFIVLALNINGQSRDEFKTKFENGKHLLAIKKYALAIDALLPLTSRHPENSFDHYASYYYSIAALETNQLDQAIAMLEQVRTRYPEWEKDNINYLLANTYFKKNSYEKAIIYLNTIQQSTIQKDGESMKLHYLSLFAPTDTLKKLHTDFPEDASIGRLLADKLLLTKHSEDKIMLEYLVRTFKLDEKKYITKTELKTKEKYTIGVLFPFSIDELSPDKTNRSNYYAIDMYEGMKIGIEELSKKDIRLELICYDVGKDNKNLEYILAKPELQSMDLIIGPFINQPSLPLYTFSTQYHIPVINPTSYNSKLTENPFQLLLHPTHDTQSKRAAEFICKTYHPQKAVIFYGENQKDVLLAKKYKQALKADSSSHLFEYHEIVQENSIDIRCILEDTLNRDIDHIFVSISDQLLAASFISELAKNGFKIPVIVAYSSWINLPMFTFEQFETLNIHFIHPDFIDYRKPNIINFRNTYLKKTNILPSAYGYIGYDAIMYLGSMLRIHGINFADFIKQTHYTKGQLLDGYNYFQSSDNQVVPIIHFKNLQPIQVNTFE